MKILIQFDTQAVIVQINSFKCVFIIILTGKRTNKSHWVSSGTSWYSSQQCWCNALHNDEKFTWRRMGETDWLEL